MKIWKTTNLKEKKNLGQAFHAAYSKFDSTPSDEFVIIKHVQFWREMTNK